MAIHCNLKSCKVSQFIYNMHVGMCASTSVSNSTNADKQVHFGFEQVHLRHEDKWHQCRHSRWHSRPRNEGPEPTNITKYASSFFHDDSTCWGVETGFVNHGRLEAIGAALGCQVGASMIMGERLQIIGGALGCRVTGAKSEKENRKRKGARSGLRNERGTDKRKDKKRNEMTLRRAIGLV